MGCKDLKTGSVAPPFVSSCCMKQLASWRTKCTVFSAAPFDWWLPTGATSTLQEIPKEVNALHAHSNKANVEGSLSVRKVTAVCCVYTTNLQSSAVKYRIVGDVHPWMVLVLRELTCYVDHKHKDLPTWGHLQSQVCWGIQSRMIQLMHLRMVLDVVCAHLDDLYWRHKSRTMAHRVGVSTCGVFDLHLKAQLE